uniref:AlNc14C23G2347 protein n=1 Tax=Albugo laibachii Nc14 TaxID=890382 RepID=F0W646_9STRA|nr:AlNc14C23G2347 [Albugo laibachii Nc14]|eukprot:CCA16588.1 AlNc14C23G2347 [Albugo laibachii Nc14]
MLIACGLKSRLSIQRFDESPRLPRIPFQEIWLTKLETEWLYPTGESCIPCCVLSFSINYFISGGAKTHKSILKASYLASLSTHMVPDLVYLFDNLTHPTEKNLADGTQIREALFLRLN